MNNHSNQQGISVHEVKHTSRKKKLVSMYCDAETHELMKRSAEAEKRSVSSWLQIAVMEKLDKEENPSVVGETHLL